MDIHSKELYRAVPMGSWVPGLPRMGEEIECLSGLCLEGPGGGAVWGSGLLH